MKDFNNNDFNRIGKEEFGKIMNDTITDKKVNKVLKGWGIIQKLLSSGPLWELADDIKDLYNMLKDWANKKYTQVPFRTILAVLGTLAYVINPFDAIPDTIPIIGQLDDLAVVKFCLKMIYSDLNQYREWKS